MLNELDLICLVSNPCSGLGRIQDCIRQADRLFKNLPSPGPGFAYYEEHAQKCLIGEAAAQLKLDSWLYQGLKFLESYDSSKKTDYHKTLCCLAKNHFVQNTTAAELFIHRNSLQYRIAKIEELLEYDLSAPDVQFFITLSALLYSAGMTNCKDTLLE